MKAATGVTAKGKKSTADALAAAVTGEYRCSACGYGIVVRHAPPGCPMCHATSWEPVAWRPFTRAVDVETELRRV